MSVNPFTLFTFVARLRFHYLTVHVLLQIYFSVAHGEDHKFLAITEPPNEAETVSCKVQESGPPRVPPNKSVVAVTHVCPSPHPVPRLTLFPASPCSLPRPCTIATDSLRPVAPLLDQIRQIRSNDLKIWSTALIQDYLANGRSHSNGGENTAR